MNLLSLYRSSHQDNLKRKFLKIQLDNLFDQITLTNQVENPWIDKIYNIHDIFFGFDSIWDQPIHKYNKKFIDLYSIMVFECHLFIVLRSRDFKIVLHAPYMI